MTADLSALIARLEAAEAGSRELDAKIALLCLPEFSGWIEHPANNGNQYGELAPSREAFDEWLIRDGDPCLIAAPLHTISLDAALALAERVLGTDQEYEITTLYNIARVTLNMNHGDESGPFYGSNDCCVVPLAICAATLRAKLDGYAAEGEVNKNPKAQEG